MNSLVDKKYWDDGWETKVGQIPTYRPFFAHRILQKYLSHDPSLSMIEIGCVPGRNMVYFAKEFGFTVAGIDYADTIKYVEPYLRSQGLTDFSLFHDDLFKFAAERNYDVVFSAGFVEHFTKVDEVFEKHYQLLKPGGTLIITLPHFRNAQKAIRILTGARASLDLHNLDVMYPYLWLEQAQKYNMKIQYCDYCMTFQFWFPITHPKLLQKLAGGTSYVLNMFLRMLRIENIPNKYFSPHILLIAQKS